MQSETNADQTWTPTTVRVGAALPDAGQDSARIASAALRVRLEAFCRALQEVTGLRVIARTWPDYATLLSAVKDGEVDIAWLPPRPAVQAMTRGWARPLVLPVRGQSSMFWAALYARKDSSIRTLADLSGKRVAWVDPHSAAGYKAIRAWLRSRGVDPDRTFSREGFGGSHHGVVAMVMAGKADVGAGYAHLDETGAVKAAAWGAAPMHVIGLAGPIPSDVLAAATALPERIAGRIQQELTGEVEHALRGAALALFEADRFEAATLEDLEPLRKLLSED